MTKPHSEWESVRDALDKLYHFTPRSSEEVDVGRSQVHSDALTTTRRLEEQLETLASALEEIESLESDGGTYDVVWDGVRQWTPKFKVIARAALREVGRAFEASSPASEPKP